MWFHHECVEITRIMSFVSCVYFFSVRNKKPVTKVLNRDKDVCSKGQFASTLQ